MSEIRPTGKPPPTGVILGFVIAFLGIAIWAGGAFLDLPMPWTAIAGIVVFFIGGGVFVRTALRRSG